jgi:hypothetical protein
VYAEVSLPVFVIVKVCATAVRLIAIAGRATLSGDTVAATNTDRVITATAPVSAIAWPSTAVYLAASETVPEVLDVDGAMYCTDAVSVAPGATVTLERVTVHCSADAHGAVSAYVAASVPAFRIWNCCVAALPMFTVTDVAFGVTLGWYAAVGGSTMAVRTMRSGDVTCVPFAAVYVAVKCTTTESPCAGGATKLIHTLADAPAASVTLGCDSVHATVTDGASARVQVLLS